MSSCHAHFVPSAARNSRNYFLGTPANSALTWVTASQKSLLHLLLGAPDHLDLRYPGQFPAHHRGLGQGVPGPPLLADGVVVEPFALVGVPQRAAPLGDRHARPPLRPPVRAVVGRRAGRRPAIPPPAPAPPAQCRCRPGRTRRPGRCRGRPVRCGSSRRCPPSPRTPSPSPSPVSAGGLQSDSTPMATSDKPVRDLAGDDRSSTCCRLTSSVRHITRRLFRILT